MASSSSLSPLDMLDMPDAEQYILRCLNRRPGLTAAEIALATKLPINEVESTLTRMVNRAQLVEQLQDEKRTFSVRFSRLQGRLRGMPSSIMSILEEKPDTFLAEVPLTSSLSPDERENLLARSTTRRLIPNEVFMWQGDRFSYVGLPRMGLLKKSRLQKGKHSRVVDYVRRAEWFGLGEMLSGQPSLDTLTAVTDTELLLWPADEFVAFLNNSARLSQSVNRLLSDQLYQCQSQRVHGTGRLWVIEGTDRQVGATSLAVNLALLGGQNGGGGNGHRSRVVLWNAGSSGQDILRMLGMDAHALSTALPDQNTVLEHPSGIHVLIKTAKATYPPQVQLDIFLTDLLGRYDYVICDTGSSNDEEILLRLRGHAERLITVTRQETHVDDVKARWNTIQPYSRPTQKRILALNQFSPNGHSPDPAFQLVLPYDPESANLAHQIGQPVVEAAIDGPLARSFVETYRRLSLDHSIGIFVPSTMDVNQSISNESQVQATLSFLGTLFGGATRSEAEGVWQSEEQELVIEQVTIVKTFVSQKALEKHLDEVIKFATRLKAEMKQEAVAIDVDNQLILV